MAGRGKCVFFLCWNQAKVERERAKAYVRWKWLRKRNRKQQPNRIFVSLIFFTSTLLAISLGRPSASVCERLNASSLWCVWMRCYSSVRFGWFSAFYDLISNVRHVDVGLHFILRQIERELFYSIGDWARSRSCRGRAMAGGKRQNAANAYRKLSQILPN